MRAVEQVERRLAERGIRFELADEWIRVRKSSPSGFDVTLTEGRDETIVFFGGWHEHFNDPEEAVRCFFFGLSPDCRVRITERGGWPYKWTLEWLDDGQWVEDSTTGTVPLKFWRRAETRFVRNCGGAPK